MGRIRTSNLANKGTDVDEKVEPVVDSLDSDTRIDNDTLTRLESPDMHVLLAKLFDNKRVDIGLETTGTEANDNDGNDHGTKRATFVLNDGRESRDDKNDVADDIDTKGIADGLVTAPVLVGNERSEEGHEILPELVESSDTSRSSLTHTKDTRLFIISTSCRALRERLLDEVGDYNRGCQHRVSQPGGFQ